jgi:hypothetical protein
MSPSNIFALVFLLQAGLVCQLEADVITFEFTGSVTATATELGLFSAPKTGLKDHETGATYTPVIGHSAKFTYTLDTTETDSAVDATGSFDFTKIFDGTGGTFDIVISDAGVTKYHWMTSHTFSADGSIKVYHESVLHSGSYVDKIDLTLEGIYGETTIGSGLDGVYQDIVGSAGTTPVIPPIFPIIATSSTGVDDDIVTRSDGSTGWDATGLVWGASSKSPSGVSTTFDLSKGTDGDGLFFIIREVDAGETVPIKDAFKVKFTSLTATATAVPEPGSMALLALAACAAAVRRRRSAA